MATEKKKKNVKVRDLKPSKDAKGGATKQQNSGRNLDAGRGTLNSGRSTNQASGRNYF